MRSARELKKELDSTVELVELLDVLKGIASSQFRALERKKERFAKFLDAFEGFFRMIDFSGINHPFSQEKGELGIIMITSDAGFMGGLNTQVINTALDYSGSGQAELIVLGERGASYLSGAGLKFRALPGITVENRYELAAQLRDHIMKEGLNGKFGRLILVYPKPVSFTVQKIEVLKILPCGELFSSVTAAPRNDESIRGVIIESSLDSIIEFLLGTWIMEKLFEVFEDSQLSEFSARTVHLEESHQVLLGRNKALRFQYFRSRHDLVDRGMRENFSAQVLRKRV